MEIIGIIGCGGVARELACRLKCQYIFFVPNNEYEHYKTNELVKPMNEFDSSKYKAIIAIGNSKVRNKIINEELPLNTQFYTFIDPFAIILDNNIEIGEGSIIYAGCVLTTNIKLGKHSILNPNTTIGHDTIIDDYFTSCPNVSIAGNCNIGKRNFFGISSSIKDNINICDDVILGLNTGVIKNIIEAGTYIGTPSKKLIK